MPPRRDPLRRLRKICLALPEAREQIAWGEPTFRVRKKLFAMYANADNHNGRGRSAVWIKARAVNQHLLIVAHPDRFFVPPYVGLADGSACGSIDMLIGKSWTGCCARAIDSSRRRN
jgi:hypothetical protein